MKKTVLALAIIAGFCTASFAQNNTTPAASAVQTKKHPHPVMHKQAALTSNAASANKKAPAKKEMKQPMRAHHKKMTSAVKKTKTTNSK
ncbi:MAG: hypothetical protein J0H92_10410 [Sphingobacteriales bacterium]|nr:hypothetical protein [Sphingobacteriales bacterium]OJW31820.1 MAG: hypothetical protein BGO54_15400 [Sphingobacteriales bacterium 46-32]